MFGYNHGMARQSPRPGPISCRWLIATALLLALQAPASTAQTEQDKQAWQTITALGDGFVVWESNRTGRWRIWHRALDGTDLRQLTPDDDREHCAPHVAPDGRHIAFLSYPRGKNSYDSEKGDIRLHVLDLETGDSRVLIDRVQRADGGNRGAVWVDGSSLQYIDADGQARRVDIRTAKTSDVLIANKHGLLLNATGGCAFERFYYHRVRDGKVDGTSPKYDGCEPYFTQDGRWGVRMSGAGGPIDRIDLTTWQREPIVRRDDPDMPRDRNYLYFPMPSPCERLIAFAASPDQHDHNSSDYDVFIMPIDPATLMRTGRPVRYTFDRKTDRYPSAYLSDLDLGRFAGEAPLTARFDADELKGEWAWQFGDGGQARGAGAQSHTYARPGTYTVAAKQENRVLRGSVVVSEAAPPRVQFTALRDDRTVAVTFDEPIDVEGVSASFEDGNNISGLTVSDERTLVVKVARPIKEKVTFRLAGVTDRAQRPNAMTATALAVEPVTWPVDDRSLVFALSTADAPLIGRAADGSALPLTLQPRGHGRVDAHYALLTDGGAYIVEGANEAILEACRASNELTVEAWIRPLVASQGGPARIVSFSTDGGQRDFTLGQDGEQLVFRLRTPKTGGNGVEPQTTIGALPADRDTHAVVTYRPGRLVAYLNGRKVVETDQVQGDFSNWTAQQLLLGDEYRDPRDWHGRIEHVAIYSRALDSAAVRRSYEQVRSDVGSRPALDPWHVKARLVALSDMPTLEQIAPYREALVVAEYERIDGKPGGNARPRRFRVAHWAILDGQSQSIVKAKPGDQRELDLQLFDANPQLQSVYLADTLDLDLDLPLCYAPAP